MHGANEKLSDASRSAADQALVDCALDSMPKSGRELASRAVLTATKEGRARRSLGSEHMRYPRRCVYPGTRDNPIATIRFLSR